MAGETEMSVEAVGIRQRRVLLGFTIASGVWQLTRIIGDFTDDGRNLGSLRGAFIAVQLLSSLVWAIYLMSMMRFRRRLGTRPEIIAVLGDELFQQTRLRAVLFAFGCVLACQAALVAASLAWPLTAKEGADMTMLVGVTSFLGSFLWIGRE